MTSAATIQAKAKEMNKNNVKEEMPPQEKAFEKGAQLPKEVPAAHPGVWENEAGYICIEVGNGGMQFRMTFAREQFSGVWKNPVSRSDCKILLRDFAVTVPDYVAEALINYIETAIEPKE